jgi:hypothetical protein
MEDEEGLYICLARKTILPYSESRYSGETGGVT